MTAAPRPDDLGSLVRDLAVGSWALAALACADETNLLDALAERRSVADLAARTGLPPAVAGGIVSVLLSLGLVRPEQDAFVAEPLLAAALTTGARSVLRAELRSNVLQSTSLVTDAREGGVHAGWSHLDPLVLHAQGRRSAFLAGMWADRLFPELDGLLGRLEGRPASFLDVGVGVATLTIGLCLRFPLLRAVGLDPLAGALHEAHANVASHALEDRVDLRPGRVEDLDDRDAYDLVHLPAMFLAPATLDAGLSRVLTALRPGGWVLVQTLSRRGLPLSSAVAGLVCALWGGESRDAGPLGRSLTEAGFEPVLSFTATSGWPVDHVAGRRPDP
ncbi:MAG: methyltransferase domain-containing protein [Actinomycetota bacterium]